ncbi:NnrS family protein [Pontibacterium granulatum]|uniref:NnrS family protein n=1 Tax=Pontibacterium granulatum TaxID=2036029 RepID=UPI00249A17E5|nr:NnrS family protein [Pontibacterium granulatum]MDI3323223.1 NnrS family protein [Pontibacterium granulatum]
MIPIGEPRKSSPFALFNLGFRPFFLFGAVAAVILLGLWLVFYSSGLGVSYYSNTMHWHAHEMLFGFSMAIIAGFLLTAVRNWTNVQTPFGNTLAGIFLLWLTARILPFIPGIPGEVIAVIDLAFAPAVAVGIGIPIVRSGNYRNLVFIPILAAFFAANLMVHLETLGVTDNTAMNGLHLALYLAVMVITVIGGRVIPFFTERGVEGVSCTRFAWIEKTVLPATGLWLISMLTSYDTLQIATSAILALLSAIRLYGWFSPTVFKVPLVWILQLGYLFIPLGYALTALAAAGQISGSIAIHSFAAGAIGLITLGMMARVSLGHTGRPLTVTPIIVAAFVLITLAAVIRVSITHLPIPYLAGLHLSGTLWMLAWILFLIRYLPILIKPRADGLFG